MTAAATLVPVSPLRRSGWWLLFAIHVPMIAFVVALTVVVRTQVPAAGIVTAMRDGSLSRTFGPRDVNRILGYELFPAPARFPTESRHTRWSYWLRVLRPLLL